MGFWEIVRLCATKKFLLLGVSIERVFCPNIMLLLLWFPTLEPRVMSSKTYANTSRITR